MEIALALIAGLALGALAVHLLGDRRASASIDDQAVADIRAGIDRLAEAQAGAMGEFRGQLGSIAQAQQSMVQSTGALSAALRRPGVRGPWGEVTLQDVCEAAGLSQHIDFEVQVHLRGGGDGAARPDLVVRRPDGGALPVDAKVPLDAYLDAAEAGSDQEREATSSGTSVMCGPRSGSSARAPTTRASAGRRRWSSCSSPPRRPSARRSSATRTYCWRR